MKISVKTLDHYCACFSQRRLFVRLFGKKGGTVTKARCLKAAQHLDFDWAASHLLFPAAYKVYLGATRKPHRKFNTRQRRIDKRTDNAFDRLYENDRAKWYAIRDAGVDEKAALRREYNKARALAFWKASQVKGDPA